MLRTASRSTRFYELMTVVSPEVSEEELSGVLDRIAGYITQAGGTVTAVNRDSPWGRRRLAYPIRYNGRDLRDGFYTLYHLWLAPSNVTEVERELKLDEAVIRYLLVQQKPKLSEGEPEAVAVAEAKSPVTEAAAIAEEADAEEPVSEHATPGAAPEAESHGDAGEATTGDRVSAPADVGGKPEEA